MRCGAYAWTSLAQDKCWLSEVGISHTYTVYPPTHTQIYIPLPLCYPRRLVTATSAFTGYSYCNHHVISASDHQWSVFRCGPVARASNRRFRTQSSQTCEFNKGTGGFKKWYVIRFPKMFGFGFDVIIRCPTFIVVLPLQHSWSGPQWKGSKHLLRRGWNTAR